MPEGGGCRCLRWCSPSVGPLNNSQEFCVWPRVVCGVSGGPRWCGGKGGLWLLVVLVTVEGLQRGPLQLGARGPRLWLVLWLVLLGRAKEGKLGRWWRGPPPFFVARDCWSVRTLA